MNNIFSICAFSGLVLYENWRTAGDEPEGVRHEL